MIEVVRVEIGSGGLPSCDRCAGSVPATYRPLESIGADVTRLSQEPVGSSVLLFSGTEAFGHPALPGIIGEAVALGVERIGLETAGSLLAVGGNAAGALHAGVRHFEIVYAPGDDSDRSREHASQLAGVRELMRVATESGARVAVSARIQSCRHSVAFLPAAVAELVQAGVGAVHIEVDASTGTGPAARASIIAACDTGIVNAVWVDVAGIELPAGHAMHQMPEAS